MVFSLKATGAVLLIAGVGWYVLLRESQPASVSRPKHSMEAIEERQPIVLAEPGPEATTKALAASPSVEVAPLDELALMAKLRELGPTDPEQAIRLAREGNLRFPTSARAAERAWFVVKSLDRLGRFHEARDEARVMVERFRGTSWAADVERHTLVYPLDQPSREEQQEWERLGPGAQEP